jgi:hypothetical protein
MRVKLHKRLSSIEAELTRLARAAELHPTAAHLQGVADDVKAARREIGGVAAATQTSLQAVTESVTGLIAKTAEAVASPVKPRGNGKAATDKDVA